MDLRHLRSFVAVYEEGSVSKAARRLNATQPGISIQISALESELCGKLFSRHSGGVRPTEAGKLLYQRATRIIRETDEAADEIRALALPGTRQVSIGIPPTLARVVTGPILQKYAERYPDIPVRVVEAYSATLHELVENGDLDFAFVTYRSEHPDMRFRKIYDDTFVLLSGKSLGLPPNQPIRLDEPPFLKLVVPPRRHTIGRLVDTCLNNRQIVPAQCVELDGIVDLVRFVSTGSWAAMLPVVAAMSGAAEEADLCLNPIAGDPIAVEYFLATAATTRLSDAAQALVRQAQSELVSIRRDYESRLHLQPA